MLPDWLLEMIVPKQQPPEPAESKDYPPAHQGRERAYAAKTLRNSVAELQQTSSGHRNNKLNATAYRLGGMVARGWIEQENVMTNLLAACHSNRLASDDGIDSVRSTISPGLNTGIARPHPDLPDLDRHQAPDVGDSPSPSLLPVVWDGHFAESYPMVGSRSHSGGFGRALGWRKQGRQDIFGDGSGPGAFQGPAGLEWRYGS